jgi:hypothetical protein
LLGAVATPVLADAYHLARALSLILQHARSSMESGSGLTVETSRIVSPDAGGPWVRTRFAYTSRGETSDMLEHAFEPSCTGARTGLPAAYALIKDMGGFVTASLETVNTVLFEVYLSPVAVLEVDAEPRPVVLLIEPNWRVGCLLQQHFSEHAIDLLCVSNCQEARLAAGLYENNLSLVLANAAADDPEREELSADLAQARSGPRVRWLNGYQEESLDGPGTHFLSKWNLLEWARQEIADAAARKSIRETRIHVLTPAD